MKIYGFLFALIALIAGCAPQMSQVMSSCDDYKKLDSYVSCIKNTYERNVNDPTVKAFYAYLDAISEDVRTGRISETRARVEVHQAYENTIGVGNRRKAKAWSDFNTQMQLQNALNSPTYTNCNAFGNSLNCTTW